MRKNPKQATSIFDAYIELTKPRITYLILISTALGYYLGSGGFIKLWEMLICLFGSALVASGSGVLNHFAEVDSDSLMRRTYLRPLPTGLIKPTRAKNFGLILVSAGIIVLYAFINNITAILAILTVILYLFVYTPLKKITWLNTSIGAIPGALPPVGGWTAASGQLEPESWILFGILYFWQHPHFYALALMYQDDYQKAGYHMLPVIEKESQRTNRQIIWHSLLLIPVSLVLHFIGMLGIFYFYGALLLGLGYFLSGFILVKNYSLKNARFLLLVSVIYLPLLFCSIVIDKFV